MGFFRNHSHQHKFNRTVSVSVVYPAQNIKFGDIVGPQSLADKIIALMSTHTSVVKMCDECGELRQYVFDGDHSKELKPTQ